MLSLSPCKLQVPHPQSNSIYHPLHRAVRPSIRRVTFKKRKKEKGKKGKEIREPLFWFVAPERVEWKKRGSRFAEMFNPWRGVVPDGVADSSGKG